MAGRLPLLDFAEQLRGSRASKHMLAIKAGLPTFFCGHTRSTFASATRAQCSLSSPR